MHEKWMKEALKEARKAFKKDEVPIGCVAVRDGKIIARAHNLRETNADPLAHAEMLCMRKAAKKLKGWYLYKVTLYTTLEPCLMCAGAMLHARMKDVVIGARSEKTGAARLLRKNRINVRSGILKEECASLLKLFFSNKRS